MRNNAKIEFNNNIKKQATDTTDLICANLPVGRRVCEPPPERTGRCGKKISNTLQNNTMKKLAAILAIFCFLQTNAQDTLSKNDIPAAARLLDLQFTQKEIDTMYDGVKENLDGYRLLHKQTLNNNVPMTLWHSPVLPGIDRKSVV